MILKTLLTTAAIVGIVAMPHELPELKLGEKAPATEVKMKDVDGKEYDLRSVAKGNGLLVIFSCNTCPFVVGGKDGASKGWEGRYPGLAEFAAKNKVGFAMVNSNTLFREKGDSYADMQQRYKDKGFKGRYLLDDNNKVADAFGARTTPHVYLFDKDLKLVYKGAIDDNVEDPAKVKEHWLTDAIAAMVGGKEIAPAQTRNIGCSIKRAHVH